MKQNWKAKDYQMKKETCWDDTQVIYDLIPKLTDL